MVGGTSVTHAQIFPLHQFNLTHAFSKIKLHVSRQRKLPNGIVFVCYKTYDNQHPICNLTFRFTQSTARSNTLL